MIDSIFDPCFACRLGLRGLCPLTFAEINDLRNERKVCVHNKAAALWT